MAARDLNACGYRAFALMSDDKGHASVPCRKGWQGDEPFSRREIDAMPWGRALAVGIAESSTNIGLDVDHKHGAKLGYEHLAALEQEYGPLPKTACFPTPSGGIHLRFSLHPEAIAFVRKNTLYLPNGRAAHIDVIDRIHRFYRVYDPQLWLDVDTVSEIPLEWAKSFEPSSLERRNSSPGSRALKPAASPPSHDLDELVKRVRNAEAGNRNTPLNDSYFIALRQGHDPTSIRSRFREAAIAAGHSPSQTDRTLDSVEKKVERLHTEASEWLAAVMAWQTSEGMNPRMIQVAQIFADLHRRKSHNQPIHMSVRELSEKVGVSHNGANKYIRKFMKSGYLHSLGRTKLTAAREFHITIPAASASKGDIQPPPRLINRTGCCVSPKAPINLDVDLRAAKLITHEAFMRLGSGPVLTPTCANMLAVLENQGTLYEKDLSLILGKTRKAITEAFKRLESAGLIHREDGRVALTSLDTWVALDEWAKGMGITRARDRAAIHAQQRERYRNAFTPPADEPDGTPLSEMQTR